MLETRKLEAPLGYEGEGDNWRNYVGADTIRWMMKGTRGMKGTKGMDCILRREEIELPR